MSDEPKGNPEIEQSVLGALLIDNTRAHEINPDWFLDPVHARICAAIQRRQEAGQQSDAAMLRTDLAGDEGLRELGGAGYLVRLSAAAVPRYFNDHTNELRALWARETMVDTMRAAADAVEGGRESVREAAEAVEATVASVVQMVNPTPMSRSALAAALEAANEVVEAFQADGMAGVPTGLHAFDRAYGGLKPGDLTILAGRPSMGKTAIALQIAWNVARAGGKVFFASLEMTDRQLVKRLASTLLDEQGAEIPYADIMNGRVRRDQMDAVMHAIKEAGEAPIVFGDRQCRSLARLRAEARKSAKSGLSLVVIDYLQLIEDTNARSDYERVSRSSTALKSLALELDCPVLALSQLNRQVERRDPPIPQLSDLRESGKIEEDADLIMMAYRPAYYVSKKLEEEPANAAELADWMALEENRRALRLFVPKARHGATGKVSLACDLRFNHVWSEGPRQNWQDRLDL